MKSIDLHGLTKEDALEKVDEFLMKNHHQNKVKIMTGKGAGVLHKAVTHYLKLGNYPWSYEKLSNGKSNAGVLIVHMND